MSTDHHLANAEARAENPHEDAIHDGIIAVQAARREFLAHYRHVLRSLATDYDVAICDAWNHAVSYSEALENPYDHDIPADPFDAVRAALKELKP